MTTQPASSVQQQSTAAILDNAFGVSGGSPPDPVPNFPQELKKIANWVLWKMVPDGNGGYTKVPFQTKVNGTGYMKAAADDPSTWTTFENVCAKLSKLQLDKGIGFELGVNGCGYVALDFDGCRVANGSEWHLADWAKEFLKRYPTYAEITPSGEGFRAIYRGQITLPNGKGAYTIDAPQFEFAKKRTQVEFFTHTRFITVTGNTLGAKPKPIADLTWTFEDVNNLVPRVSQTGSEPSEVSQSQIDYLKSFKYEAGQDDNKKDFAMACAIVKIYGPIVGFERDRYRDEFLKYAGEGKTRAHGDRKVESRPDYVSETLEAAFKQVATTSLKQGNRTGVKSLVTEVNAKLIWGDQTTLDQTEWLIPNFVPVGKPSGFTGEMDTRKSTLALDIAAAGSSSRTWFNGSPNTHSAFTTLIGATEDSYGSTILPRFVAAGGDPRRIALIPGEVTVKQSTIGGTREYTTPFSLSEYVNVVDRLIRETNKSDRGPVKLLIFDPLISFFGDKNVNNPQESGVVMTQIKKLCEDHQIAWISIMHYNKTQGLNAKQKTGLAARVCEAHRMLWSFTLDNNDANITNVTPTKKNEIAHATGHRITTVSKAVKLSNGRSDEKGVIKYLGTTTKTSDGEVQAKEDREWGKRKEIRDAILTELKNGAKPAGEVKYNLRDVGSGRTIERYANDLLTEGLIVKTPGQKNSTHYTWGLPDESESSLF